MTEKEIMKEAYGMLYDIETKLKRIVVINLSKHYGYTWLMKSYERKMYLHDLISFFGKYPDALPHFDKLQLRLFYKLPEIRNKVAHVHLINDEEFKHLKKCHSLIKRTPFTKRKKTNIQVI